MYALRIQLLKQEIHGESVEVSRRGWGFFGLRPQNDKVVVGNEYMRRQPLPNLCPVILRPKAEESVLSTPDAA